jgi:hypothetical protein
MLNINYKKYFINTILYNWLINKNIINYEYKYKKYKQKYLKTGGTFEPVPEETVEPVPGETVEPVPGETVKLFMNQINHNNTYTWNPVFIYCKHPYFDYVYCFFEKIADSNELNGEYYNTRIILNMIILIFLI